MKQSIVLGMRAAVFDIYIYIYIHIYIHTYIGLAQGFQIILLLRFCFNALSIVGAIFVVQVVLAINIAETSLTIDRVFQTIFFFLLFVCNCLWMVLNCFAGRSCDKYR